MERYVLGFAFSEGFSQVLLIEKNRPAWQKGLLNGLGGKVEVEQTEIPREAMVREFEEESGMKTQIGQWKRFGKMIGKDWVVHLYAAEGIDIYSATTTTDEKVVVVDIGLLHNHRVVSNLGWLIAMALDGFRTDFEFEAVISYH